MQLPKRESEAEGFKHFHRVAVLPARRPQLRLRSVGTFITIKVPETSVLLYENRILVNRLPKPASISYPNFRPHRTGGSAHCCCSDRRDFDQFSSAKFAPWQFPHAHLKVGTDLPFAVAYAVAEVLLLSPCSWASPGASGLQDLHLAMLLCSQRIRDTIRNLRYRIFCATLCLFLKPSNRKFPCESVLLWNPTFVNIIYFDSETGTVPARRTKPKE